MESNLLFTIQHRVHQKPMNKWCIPVTHRNEASRSRYESRRSLKLHLTIENPICIRPLERERTDGPNVQRWESRGLPSNAERSVSRSINEQRIEGPQRRKRKRTPVLKGVTGLQ